MTTLVKKLAKRALAALAVIIALLVLYGIALSSDTTRVDLKCAGTWHAKYPNSEQTTKSEMGIRYEIFSRWTPWRTDGIGSAQFTISQDLNDLSQQAFYYEKVTDMTDSVVKAGDVQAISIKTLLVYMPQVSKIDFVERFDSGTINEFQGSCVPFKHLL